MRRWRVRGAITVLGLGLMVSAAMPRSAFASGPQRVTGGGGTTITSLLLAGGGQMAVTIPTHLGIAAVKQADGTVGGSFNCLINTDGFQGNFMHLHGDVEWLVVASATDASFGGVSNFGPYRVTVDLAGTPTLHLAWTQPFGPGVTGTVEELTNGTVQIDAGG